VVCPTSRPATKCELDGQLTWTGHHRIYGQEIHSALSESPTIHSELRSALTRTPFGRSDLAYGFGHGCFESDILMTVVHCPDRRSIPLRRFPPCLEVPISKQVQLKSHSTALQAVITSNALSKEPGVNRIRPFRWGFSNSNISVPVFAGNSGRRFMQKPGTFCGILVSTLNSRSSVSA
jgi:hypothetical protein